ncbi:MAG TPA: Type 1 glutamine amidotransferase-like domain-containing protein [Mycobacteriales bacterium]|jgi:cyanophycinase-like exopeptidase|nr:Type 1 glutamine amidotransferase-like domain-containing protein [Mycobacteriales bacterium]
MPGQLALVGSGEYLEVMAEVEGRLLAGGRRYVQLPTAAAPEGEASLARWVALGRAQAERLGVEAVPVVVRDREQADDPALAALVEGASLVYLSGGNPPYLAATLRGTLVWEAVAAAWRDGAALAGCSAGAMALTSWVPDLRRPGRPADPGLGVLPQLRVIPHFDRFLGWLPDLVSRYLLRAPEGTSVVGVDEDTAVVWDGTAWTVHGRQSAWLLTPDGRSEFAAGATVPLPGPV